MKDGSFQSQECNMSALPIRIAYAPQRSRFPLPPKTSGLLFDFSLIDCAGRGQTNGTTHLDPFEIRRRFNAIHDSEAARAFFSGFGMFGPPELGPISWNKFVQWQQYFYWLRQDRNEAMKTPEGAQAWRTAEQGENEFFTDEVQSPMGVLVLKDLKGEDEALRAEIVATIKLWELRRFALCPGGPPDGGNRVSIGWYDPKDSYVLNNRRGGYAPENWQAPWNRHPMLEGMILAPYLRIEARNILEAIAATIYAERHDGVRYRKCAYEPCRNLFKVESKHHREFCPYPSRSYSYCEVANKKAEARRRKNDFIDLFLGLRSKGVSEGRIIRSRSVKALGLGPKAIENAIKSAKKVPKSKGARATESQELSARLR
jgi:hypothetical protein